MPSPSWLIGLRGPNLGSLEVDQWFQADPQSSGSLEAPRPLWGRQNSSPIIRVAFQSVYQIQKLLHPNFPILFGKVSHYKKNMKTSKLVIWGFPGCSPKNGSDSLVGEDPVARITSCEDGAVTWKWGNNLLCVAPNDQ